MILSEAEAVLARCLEDQDYDLAGEVLLTWPLLNTAWTTSSAFAFQVLKSVEDKAGFLPTPSVRLNRLRRLDGAERTRYWLATSYHTIFVMGILCALALQRDEKSHEKVAKPSFPKGCAEIILGFMDTATAAKHWQDELKTLSSSEQDILARLLLNIALYRNAKAQDFGRICELLKLACELGIGNMPAARQAAELLERVAAWAPATPKSLGREEPQFREDSDRSQVCFLE
jgi:hypothetical protein